MLRWRDQPRDRRQRELDGAVERGGKVGKLGQLQIVCSLFEPCASRLRSRLRGGVRTSDAWSTRGEELVEELVEARSQVERECAQAVTELRLGGRRQTEPPAAQLGAGRGAGGVGGGG